MFFKVCMLEKPAENPDNPLASSLIEPFAHVCMLEKPAENPDNRFAS